jgi:hypothetical protein
MAESVPCFVALSPDQTLSARIRDAKAKALALSGPQLYLADPPHITAYVGLFRSIDAARAAFLAISHVGPPPAMRMVGWHVFEDDVLTGCHTLVAAVAPEAEVVLRQLQDRVLTAMAPLRDPPACESRYAHSWTALSPLRRDAVRTTGFPFVGTDWQPHLTIASIRPADWPKVWDVLQHEPVLGTYRCEALVLYRLDGLLPHEVMRVAL